VVSNTIFAMDAESFQSEKPVIREMGRKIFGDTSFMFNAYFILVTMFPVINKIYKMPFVKKEVENFFSGLMRDAIAHRQTNNISRVDYMEYLLQLQKNKSLTSLEMAAHSVTFFLDGFETSSIFIAHTLFEVIAGFINRFGSLRIFMIMFAALPKSRSPDQAPRRNQRN
jgi:Cytochrome P450